MRKIILLAFVFTAIISCKKDENNDPKDEESTAADILNAAYQINRAGSFTVNPDDVEVDNSVIVFSGGNGYVPLRGGDEMNNTISFESPTATITAVGMRFGNTGPITFVPLTPEEIASGICSFPFTIDPTVCEDISQICHDIKCNEFAMTSAGKISQADLQDIALICGACDEPSCLELLDESVCEGISGADGSPRFNLTWSGSADLDLYVTDPSGETISYQHTASASGGLLDVDCTGNCSGGNSENITWETGGPSGTYTFYVNYFSGNGTVPFNIIVRDNSQTIRTESSSVANSGDNSSSFTYTKN
jgi:hypothetical protein